MLWETNRAISFLLVLVLLSGLLAGCSSNKTVSAKVDQKLELAIKYLSEQKYEQAVLAYQEVIKIDSKNVTAYKGLSLAYALQEKPAEAEKTLQDGLKALSNNEQLQLAMAGLMLDQNKGEQAEAIYKKLLNQDSPSVLSYQAYTYYLNREGKQADAITLLEHAIARNSKDYKLNSMLAELYFKNGDKEKALAAINKSLSAEPNQSAAYKQLAELYEDQWSELINLGEQYIQQSQAKTGQLLKLSALLGMGKYEDVIKLYGELATDVKDSARVRYIAAQAYSKLNKKDLSDQLMKSIKVDNLKDAGMLADLANFYLENGDKDNARKIALQGIDADDTALENYVVMFKLDGGADQDISEVWLIKYLINNIKGIFGSLEDISLMGIDYKLLVQEKTQSEEIIRTTSGVTVNATYQGKNKGFRINLDPNQFSNKNLKDKAKYWKFNFSPISRTGSTEKLNNLLSSGGGTTPEALGSNIIQRDIWIGTSGAFYVQIIFLAEDKSVVGFYETAEAVFIK